MKRFLFAVFVCLFALTLPAFSLATIGGTIVRMNLSQRKIVIKLKSGSERVVFFVPGAKAYKLNQPALFSSFHVGEYVVVKICNPLNEKPWKANLLMDSYSAKQYSAYHKIVPVYKPSGGGFATSAGAAPESLPPVTGVYPNAVTNQWPNNNAVPKGISWGQPIGGGMKAAPSPWGSPAMGAVLSGPSSNGSGSSVSNSTGAVQYNTGSSAVKYPTSTTANPTNGNNLGITPQQGQWAANPTAEPTTRKLVTIQGRIRRYDASGNVVYVKGLADKKMYTVQIRKSTKVLDYFTKQPIAVNGNVGKVAVVYGVLNPNNIVYALKIQIQR